MAAMCCSHLSKRWIAARFGVADRGRPADAKAALAAVREDLEQLALLIEQEAAAD